PARFPQKAGPIRAKRIIFSFGKWISTRKLIAFAHCTATRWWKSDEWKGPAFHPGEGKATKKGRSILVLP
ncbi:MAG: hypothetical protein ACKO44_04405, partial [Algoriphagus sp.]